MRGIKLLDANTLQQLSSLDGYAFPWAGNHALGQGRLSISADSHWLAATINNGVRLYDVSQELTGQYLGGCASQTPSTASDDGRAFNDSDQFDAWGWPHAKAD